MNRAPEHSRRMALDTLTYTAQGPVLDALIKTAALSQGDRSEICTQAAGLVRSIRSHSAPGLSRRRR